MQRTEAESGMVVTAGPGGGRQKLDTETRCWDQDVCEFQASGRLGISGLLFEGHTLLQPVQSHGVMELHWTVTQSSVSPAGSNRVMTPQPLILSEILSLAQSQQLSFCSTLLGAIHPMGFASRWQTTPGRGPHQPATEVVASGAWLLNSAVTEQQTGLLPALWSLP